MKIAGVIVLSIVVFLTLVWFFMLRAPSPERVCEHLMTIAVDEAGEGSPNAVNAYVDHLRLTCTREKRTKLRLRGKYHYAEHAKCIMRAETLAQAEGC